MRTTKYMFKNTPITLYLYIIGERHEFVNFVGLLDSRKLPGNNSIVSQFD